MAFGEDMGYFDVTDPGDVEKAFRQLGDESGEDLSDVGFVAPVPLSAEDHPELDGLVDDGFELPLDVRA